MPFVTKTALLPIIRWVQKYTLEIRLELFRTLFKEASKSGKAGIGRQIERNIRCRLFGEKATNRCFIGVSCLGIFACLFTTLGLIIMIPAVVINRVTFVEDCIVIL
ncbi:hypothetical protein T4A_10577 [Trichinella pseudospiralis]|uniref:Uncharacterized protein n=1 Tax=Trichinella pseudospiralis TaxID=6337 RepID=A0A0V1EVU8_TRIPS|nr:hypothetical protein T4A_10577 [Trichinella pseudospiralis]